MISFNQLEQVITNAIQVHHLAADMYQQLREQTDSQRLELLLDKMIARDRRLGELVDEYLQRADPNIRNTYLQYTHQYPAQTFIESLYPAADEVSVDTVSKIGEEIHRYQVELLQGAVRQVSGRGCLDLLDDLLLLEEAEQRNFSLTAEGNREM